MFLSSYRIKLIGLFSIIALIPIILFSFSVHNRINTYIINENLKAKTSFITNEAEKLDIWLKANAERVNDISASYPFIESLMNDDDGHRRVNDYLASQVRTTKEITNLRLVLENGREFSASGVSLYENPRGKAEYKDAIFKGELVWTMQEENADFPETITASVPLLNTNSQVEGVLLVDFSIANILNKIREISSEDRYISYAVTKQGHILEVFGRESVDSDDSSQDYEGKISALVSKTMHTYVEKGSVALDKEHMVFYSTVPSIQWRILTLVPRQVIFDSLTVLIKNIVVITAISLLFLVVLAMLFSRVFSEPLVKLKKGALEIKQGNYDYNFDIKKEDEFGQVAIAFNDMAQKLKESYEDSNDKNTMLMEANVQLQEIYIELEASYGQLKATTDQLNESEQKFRVLLGNLDDLVLIVDKDLKIVFTNDQVESVLKVGKEHFLGRSLRTLVNYADKEGKELLNDVKTLDFKNREIRITNKYKDDIIIEISSKRVYEGNELIAIHGIVRDITERRNLEESIIKRNEELIVINRISRALTSAMNIDTLMQGAVDGIIRLMDISLCTIRTLEDEKLILKAYGGDISNLVVTEVMPVDADKIGEVAKTGKTQVFELKKNYEKSIFSEKLVDSGEIGYFSVIPIKVRGRTLGIMTIGSKKKLNKGEFNVLASISNQVSLITENIGLYQGLKTNYLKTIETLAAAIEAKDEYTEGHSNRVARYCLEIAKYMGMPRRFCEEIEVAGILHDVGKIGIKDGVLSKPGRLTEREYEAIRKHPIIGSKILESVGFSESIMNGIKFHHKRYDLKGYPQEIYIEELPLEAAIIGVADAFDAMTTSRAYRNAITIEEAIEELIKNKGTQFNPYIVDIMVDVYKKKKMVIESIMQINTTIESTSLA